MNANGQLGDGTTTQQLSLVQMSGVAGATKAIGGRFHSIILLNDGTLKSVGYNGSGQLGDGTFTPRTTPVVVGGISGVIAITAGTSHTMALTSAGSVYAWGLNGSGQLGDGTTTNRSAPTLISSLSSVTKIGVGFDHGLAVDSAGVVYSWGANGNGQLGDGTQIGRSSPVAISGADYAWRVATPLFSVAGGTYNTDRTVALTSDTGGATIHYTRDGAEPTETDLAVASGGTVMVTESQTLKAKAFVTGMPPSATATAVYTMQVATPSFSPAGGTYTSPRMVSISTTTPGSTLYYTTDGTVPTVSSPIYTAPFTVSTTTTVKAIGMKANWSNSSVQTVTYTMNFGTLAAPTINPSTGSYVGDLLVTLSTAQSGAVIRYTTNGSTPTASSTAYVDPIVVSTTSTVKAKAFHPDYTTSAEASATYTMTASTPVLSVASGSYAAGTAVTISSPDSSATIRLTTSGLDPTASDPVIASGTAILIGSFTLKAKAFRTGALDSGVASATYTLTSSYGIGAVAAGTSHTIVATPDGVVYAWGANNSGQLGDGTTSTSPRTTPTLIQGLTGVIQLAAGASHTLALRADGTVWSFGYNGFGQLGDGTNTQRTSPVRITTLTGVVAIAAGDSHSLALTSDGRVWTWGYNGSGQLGQGSTTSTSVPTMISGLTGIIAIAAGSSHTLAVKGDGTVWSFGANGSGQLGDGTTSQHTSPVQMTGVSTASAVSGGSAHSLIRLTNGTLFAVGSNSGGQLGDGTTTPRWTPVAVASLSNVLLIDASASQSYAVLADGTLWAWGANGNGQLGDGTTTAHSWAQPVAGPTGVTQVASGQTHAVAVTNDGVVWTWGGNGSGQLGDGSTLQRLTPDTISASNYQWRVAVPVFSPAGGTFTANQNVVVTSATPGAIIHYTLNGNDPTEADPTVASGSTVLIDQTRTLKARAWKAGVPTSATTTSVFTLAVGSISMSPTGGTFTSPTTVTLSTATSGATIRYTIDGTTPTESSTAYTGPLNVSTTTVIKAVGFKANWSSSAVASATYTMNFGTLSAPTISPGTGGYSGSVTVTLGSNQSGAIVRYTTNGSTPTSSSTAYTSPLVIASSLTLKAKAFHSDYTTSPEASAGYTITLIAPTFSLAGGTYAPGTAVTVTSPDPTATIRITLNGSDPTSTDPILANGSSVILGNFTLKARAFKTGVQDSPVTSAIYALDGQLSVGAVAAGGSHTVLATPGGLVYVWGLNSSGQLGDGSLTMRTTPTLLQSITGVTQVAAGNAHSLVLRADGTVWAFGANGSGQLGDGTTTQHTSPTQVPGLTNVIAIGAGDTHSIAITSDGRVWTWGINSSGQLGQGNTTLLKQPTEIAGFTGAIAVAGGTSHTLILKNDGTVWGSGANNSGQLGDGTPTQRLVPTQMTSIATAQAIAAGASHSLVLLADGTVKAVGANISGQLGDNTNIQKTSPISVTNLGGVTAIAAGGSQSLALLTDGTLRAWGSNSSGQLGDGTTTNRWLPTAVLGPPVTAVVESGTSSAAAVTPDAHVWTWGSAASGQLGDGSTSGTRPSPQDVFTATGVWGQTPAPTVSVLGGTYHSSLTVTVGNVRSDVVMHYTTSGQVPTESDPIVAVGGQIAIDSPLTLRVRAWSSTLPPSSITSAVYVLQPATPTASPAPGMYTTLQTVSLATTTSGASIHYTTDGSDPDQSSPVYTGPFSVTGIVTVKARALRDGWIDGDVLAAQYTIELTPPVITAQTSPAPNAAGWYDGTVTVTFTCIDPESGITFCTAPQQVSGEGAGVEITGTATNGAGLSSFIIVPLSIDRTAPYVSVWSPRNGETLPDSATSVTIRGGITDLSGVDTVTCGAVSATVTGTTFACMVPVSSGSNQLHVAAQDRAGHITTRDFNVDVGGPVTSIEISPATMTMIAGATRRIVVTDDRGRNVTGGMWSVDQPLVASVSETDGVTTVSAQAPGQATITVTSSGLTAVATVTVLAEGSTIPEGTTLWSLTSSTGVPPRGEVLRAVPTADGDPADAPALFFVDEGAQLVGSQLLRWFNRPTSIAATTMDGRRLWEHRFTGPTASHFAADNQGGVVLVLPDNQTGLSEYNPGTIRRLDGRTGAVTWEYIVEGGAGSISEVAIHPDGTVYAFEAPYYGASVYLIGIDPSGATQRWQLPRSTSAYRMASAPIVQEDGSVVTFSTEQWGDPADKGSPRLITLRNGTLQVDEVQFGSLDFQYDRPEDWRLLPDGNGGLLWAHRTQPSVCRISSSLAVTCRQLMSQFNGSYLSMEYVLAEDGAYAVVQGVNGSGSTPHWAKVLAFDPVTLQETYVPTLLGPVRADQSQLQVRFAVRGGGVYVVGPSEAYAVNIAGSANGFAPGGNGTQVFSGVWSGWDALPSLTLRSEVTIGVTRWPYAKGDAQAANAPRLWYPTVDGAAAGSLQFYNPISIMRNREFGGSICRIGPGQYFPTIPDMNPVFSDFIDGSTCASAVIPGAEQPLVLVGRYHTHGKSGEDSLSAGDKNKADTQFPGIPSYVGTPCGKIFRYVGPNGHIEVNSLGVVVIGERLVQRTATTEKCIVP